MTEIRLVLIGKTGVGKSDTGNTILGEELFKSDMSDHSVTTLCKSANTKRNGKHVLVVDTPGIYDTHKANEETLKQIMQCIGLSSPGPHAMLLVLSLGSRFTKEEQAAVNELIQHFGSELEKYLIVVFTRSDDLKRKNKTIQQHLESASAELKSLIKHCNDRYIAFDNTDRSNSCQVDQLLEIIDTMVKNNGGSHYSSEMYEKAEEMLQAAMKENRRKLEEQKQKELEEIKQKVIEIERKKLLIEEAERKYAELQSAEFQRQKVRERVEKDSGFLNDLWGVVKTTAAVVTSPVWLPLLGIAVLIDKVIH